MFCTRRIQRDAPSLMLSIFSFRRPVKSASANHPSRSSREKTLSKTEIPVVVDLIHTSSLFR